MRKRMISVVLTLCMLLGLMPTAALAAETPTPHDENTTHPICGKVTCEGHMEAAPTAENPGATATITHNDTVTWAEWTKTDSLPDQAGNYYLSVDVTLGDTWTVNADINLCLNGHIITGKRSEAGDPAVQVSAGKTLSVCDCTETKPTNGGVITKAAPESEEGDNAYGAIISIANGGTFNLYSGKVGGRMEIYGSETPAPVGNQIDTRTDTTIDIIKGGGVYVGGGGTFNMYGGYVINNDILGSCSDTGKTGYDRWGACGGGVYVDANSTAGGKFNMYGGSVQGNSATHGAGVFVGQDLSNPGTVRAEFTMYGGSIYDNTFRKDTKITDNNKSASGVLDIGKFDMYGGKISGNNDAYGLLTRIQVGSLQAYTGECTIDGSKATIKSNTIDIYLKLDTVITYKTPPSEPPVVDGSVFDDHTDVLPGRIDMGTADYRSKFTYKNTTYRGIYTLPENGNYFLLVGQAGHCYVTKQPSAPTLAEGESIIGKEIATEGIALSAVRGEVETNVQYQWLYSTKTNLPASELASAGNKIEGAGGKTFTIGNLPQGNLWVYCRLMNNKGEQSSYGYTKPIKINIPKQEIKISGQPTAPIVDAGESPAGKEISVTASGGNGTLSYQWYYSKENDPDSASTTKVPDANNGNTSTCTIPELPGGTEGTTYYFWCVITDTYDQEVNQEVTTNTVAVTFPGTVVEVPNGKTVTTDSGTAVKHDGTAVTVTPSGQTTPTITITLPDASGKVTVDKTTDAVTVPAGSKIQVGNGPEVTVNDETTVGKDGKITVPAGGNGSVTVTDYNGTTTVTPPADDGLKVTGQGVEVPAGGTVQTGSGPEVTLDDGGTVKPGGAVTVPTGGTASITDGGTTTTVTPPDGADLTVTDQGVKVPGGGKVDNGVGSPTVTVQGGGTVKPGGDIEVPAGGSVTLEDTSGNQSDVTLPTGGSDPLTVTPKTDGTVTVPGGSTIQKESGGPAITVEGGQDAEVKPNGTVTVPGGGSVSIPDGNGGKTTITVPAGSDPGTFKPNTDGSVNAPGGSTVKKPDDSDGGTVPEVGGNVYPDGTISGGGSTVITGTQTIGTNTTITIPTGKTGTDNGDGSATVPSGTTVQTGSGPVVTVGTDDTNVEDGKITVPAGGTVTIEHGGSTTTITVPGGGDVTPTADGKGVKVPGGSTAQVTDGTNTTTVTLPSGGGGITPNSDGTITVPAGSTVTKPGGAGSETLEKESKVAPDGTVTPAGGGTGDAVRIDTQPTAPGGSGSPVGKKITVAATGGSGGLEYEWFYNTTDSTTGGTPVGPASTDAGCTIPDLPAGDYWFYCKVTDPSDPTNTATTDTVKITIPSKPGGTLGKPGTATTADGTTVERSGDGQTVTVTPPGGGTSTTITLPDPDGEVRVNEKDNVITVPEGSTVKSSDPSKPAITTGKGDVTVTTDGDVNLFDGGTATVGGGGSPTTTITGGGGGTTTVTPKDDGTVDVDGGSVKTDPVTGGGQGVEIALPGGGSVSPTDGSVKPKDGIAGVDQDGDGKAETTITLPGGSSGGDTLKPTGDGGVTVPGGTTVQNGGNGPKITVDDNGGKGGTITPEGGIALPGGGTVTVPDKGGSTATITVPSGGGTVTSNEDGTTGVTGGASVTPTGGQEMELPDGGKVTQEGGVIPTAGGSVVTGGEDGKPQITVTPPADGSDSDRTVTTDSDKVTVPDGSAVQSGSGPEMGLPQGGQVDSTDGGVIPAAGGSVTVGGGSGGTDPIAITPPAGSGDEDRKVTANADGTANIPSGSTVKSGGADSPEIKVPSGGTVNPGSGEVTAPKVEVNGTTISNPGSGGSGGTVTTDRTGTTGVEIGTEIQNGNITVTVVGGEGTGSGTVDKDGTVTFPDGGTVEIRKADGTETTTTIEKGGSISVDPSKASEVEGTVTENGEIVSEATVILQKGNRKFARATTGADGKYSFMCIPRGKYNIVATSGTKTKTELITLDESKETMSLTMPSDNVSSKLEVVAADTTTDDVGANVYETMVGGLDNEAEKQKVDGKMVTVTMTVEAKEENTAPNADAIKTEAKGKKLEYLEIKVEKKVDNDVSILPQTQTLLTIIIPFNFGDKKDVKVYRYHGGGVDTLEESNDTTKERIKLDTSDSTITMYVKNFSTYAIGYTTDTTEDPPPAPEQPGEQPVVPVGPSGGYDDDDDDDVEPAYRPTVGKTSHGNVTVSPKNPKKGEKVTITAAPEDGYEVREVTVKDARGVDVKVKDNGDGTYSFTQPAGRVSVDVAFQPVQTKGGWETCSKDGSCPIGAFGDASAAAWYHDGVHYCVENGLMNGYANGTFGPNNTLSRAQLVQILYNREGRPAVYGGSTFNDVAAADWCSNAVTWASQNGIVNGYSDGSFKPNNPINREQLAAILYRYAKAKGDDVSVGERTSILGFQDAGQVGEYAIPALQWATGAGVISGTSATTLSPKSNATRAQAAVMLMRFCTLK